MADDNLDVSNIGLPKQTVSLYIERLNKEVAICIWQESGSPDRRVTVPIRYFSAEDMEIIRPDAMVNWIPGDEKIDDQFALDRTPPPTPEQQAEFDQHAREVMAARRDQQAKMAAGQNRQGLERTFTLDR